MLYLSTTSMSARGPDWTRTLSRLDSNSPGGVIRPVHLLTELVQRGGDADLDITLTDGKNVWLGSIDTKQLMEYGSKHNFENLEEYLSVTHAALTGKSLCPPSDEGTKPWEFELKTEDGNMRNVSFVWKKSLSSGIKVHYGAVSMSLQEGGVTDLLDQVIAEMGRRDDKADKYWGEREECERQREEAMELVKRAVEGKVEFEKEIICSFNIALNKKKEKIRCLKEELKLINRIRSGVDLRDSESDTGGEGSEEQEATAKDASSSTVETEKKSALLKARMTVDKDEDDITGPPLKKRTRVSKATPKDLPKYSAQSSKQKGRAASRKGKTSLNADDLIKDM